MRLFFVVLAKPLGESSAKVKKANQWKLWKVKDLIKGTKKWKALEGIEDSNTETVIKNELKGDKLSPAMDLKDVFLMMTFRKV
ncbi:hypothetical protein RIR_jg20895.t1 [Rhizophagus irregularis DAOM 181602=DAOM 197198]|nr:hypothetical protein RIR_jg20895.t1 [Rhizophagus irregularis DAOM 181602=DAOM 197198]